MDNLPPQDIPAKSNPFDLKTIVTGVGIGLGIIAFIGLVLILTGILDFGVKESVELKEQEFEEGSEPRRISLDKVLNFLSQEKIQGPTGDREFRIVCPVLEEFCYEGVESTFRGSPALVYSLPPETSILSLATAWSASSIAVNKNLSYGARITYGFPAEGSCYYALYTIPKDSVVMNDAFLNIPLPEGREIARLGQTGVQGESANLILQLKKTFLGKNTSCPVPQNVSVEDIGEWQPLSANLFIP